MNNIDNLINRIYKNVFYLDYSKNKLKYKSEIICNNNIAILEFLGLCNTMYSHGFKKEESLFEYIKGSHYFNIDYFDSKAFKEYHSKNPKSYQYEYKKNKIILINPKDILGINEKYLLKNLNNLWQITLLDYENHNFKTKYPTIKFTEDTTIYLNSLKSFFTKYA